MTAAGAAPDPALSVVLPTDAWTTIRPVVQRLRRQSVAGRIELVLVVPSRLAAGLDGMLDDEAAGLAAWTVVEVGDVVPLARARAAGVRAARAPLVFLGETHSFPQPGFAAAVLAAAADGTHDVVVPVFGNANPNGLLSWAGFLADYGPWTPARAVAEPAVVPIFNSIYRRSVLLALGERLEPALGHGDELVLHLRRGGHRAVVARGACLEHLNVARLRPWVVERLTTGWLIGAARSLRWSWSRRLAYAAASPLIAGVLASRTLPARPPDDGTVLPRGTALVMIAGSALKAFGEAAGYLLGPSPAVEARADELEIHKLAYAARGRS